MMKNKKILIFFGSGIVMILVALWWFHSMQERTITPTYYAPYAPEEKSPRRQKKEKASISLPEKTPSKKVIAVENSPVVEKAPITTSPAALRQWTEKGAFPPLIYIPNTKKRHEIFTSLRRQGVPLWLPDRYLLLPKEIKPGWIRLERPVSLKSFFRDINRYPREKTRRIVMYSGDSLDDFAHQFSRLTQLSVRDIFDDYFRYSPYIDGGILAGYYRLPYRLASAPAMAYMTEKSEKTFTALAEKYLGHYDPTDFKRYLIVASIIQRETWHPEEMPLIAAVIYNRLKKNMRLQIDATLNYGPYSHQIVTPERIRRDTSRFNTYRYRGLPPEPLGSVTRDALTAALHPAKSRDLYFVRNIYGTHDFAPDYAAHLANISRIKAEKAKLDRNKKAWEKLEKSR